MAATDSKSHKSKLERQRRKLARRLKMFQPQGGKVTTDFSLRRRFQRSKKERNSR